MTTPEFKTGHPHGLYQPESTPEFDESVRALLELISQNETFLVVSHAHPDGDAVGSTLAMGLLLEQMGKSVTFFNVHAMPYNFGFLPGADRWVSELADDFAVDVTIMLDCAEQHRVGEGFPENGWGETIAVVDHHKTWDDSFARVYVRDPRAAATGEVIYRILAASTESLGLDLARCLYCCLMTDTGSFRYSSASCTTFRVAGELLGAGVDVWEMTSQIYESQPLERLQLLAKVLPTLSTSAGGRLAFIRLEQSMFDETGTTSDYADGFINHARGIRGVEVATQLLETGAGQWKVSFRSRGQIDVSTLAERFGGGGHRNAAGCAMTGTSDEVEAALTQALEELVPE